MSDNIKINKIPSPTWNWLKMNDVSVKIPDVSVTECVADASVPENVIRTEESSSFAGDITGGCGDEFTEVLIKKAGKTDAYQIGAGQCADGPVVLRYGFGNNAASFNKISVTAEKNSQITILMDMSSAKDAEGTAAVQTILRADEGAKIHLIQIGLMGSGYTLMNDIGAEVAENGKICISHLFLGGNEVYQGCRIDLTGDNAKAEKEIGYFLSGRQKLDTNYSVLHKGKKTESDIKVSGVLSDEAYKLFRGTIDFCDGCAGSKGNEIEEVILRGDDVINKTIPVILCEEEDVEGSHGATIGRLDEELLFYLESRGLEEEEIYRIIVDSRLTRFCRLIPNEDIRAKTFGFLSEAEQ